MGDRQAAEAIGGQRIDAGNIENDIGLFGEDRIARPGAGGEVLGVGSAVRKPDVQVGWGFFEGIVVCAMHACNECARLAGENGGIAIALVYVEIEHGGAPDRFVREQGEDRDRAIVEHAEPRATVASCVMGSPGQLARNQVVKSIPGGGQRASDGRERARDEHFAPRQSDPRLLFAGEAAFANRHDIVPIMAVLEFDIGGFRGRLQVVAIEDAARSHGRSQHAVLFRGETVSRRERDWRRIGKVHGK